MLAAVLSMKRCRMRTARGELGAQWVRANAYTTVVSASVSGLKVCKFDDVVDNARGHDSLGRLMLG